MNRVLHISFNNNIEGGGIYFYLKDLTNIQKKSGIDCHWITIKNNNKVLTRKELVKRTINIKPNIIHIHGVWNLGTRTIPQLKKITKNIIVSPHGMLNKESLRKSYLGKRISFQYLKKQLYIILFEKSNLKQIKYFHALTEAESNEIKSIFPEKPIKIIKSGFKRFHSKVNYNCNENLKNFFQKPNKILLFMSRLDRQKGLIELMSAWNQVIDQAEFYNWWLLIAGFGDLKKQVIANANKSNSRIIFNGPIDGDEKNFILQNSKGFILPSYNEGLPISVLEALSFKTTCLISESCNINNLIDSNIFLKIDITKKSNNIKESILKLFELSEKDLEEREESGLKYLEKNHNWEEILYETKIFYKDLCKN